MLSDKECMDAEPKERLYRLHDGRGLYLEVKSTGVKAWRYRFTLHGKASMYALGKFPELSLEDARLACIAASHQVERGINPAHARKSEKIKYILDASQTFELMAQRWLVSRPWASITKIRRLSLLQKVAFPVIGKQPVSAVTADHIRFIVDAAVERGAVSVALQVGRTINAIIEFSLRNRGVFHEAPSHYYNPKHTTAQALPGRDAILTEYEARQQKLKFRCYAELQKLSSSGTQTLSMAEWPEFNLDQQVWEIPAQRSPTGDQLSLRLPGSVVGLLKELAAIIGQQRYVFPNKHRSGPMSVRSLKQGLAVLS